MDLGEVMDKLYPSEINCAVSTFWDGGFCAKLGDSINGYLADSSVKTSQAAAYWLDAEAGLRDPQSVYAAAKGVRSVRMINR